MPDFEVSEYLPSEIAPPKKDWEPLRALAQKRGRIALRKVWEDPAADKRIWRIEFKRFCYVDYVRDRTMSITETPLALGITCSDWKDKKRDLISHYIVSFKHGRLALYTRKHKARIFHAYPWSIDLTRALKLPYPEAEKRFEKRLVKMLRSKARKNGVKLPKGDDLQVVLAKGLWPAMTAVQAQIKTVRGEAETWTPGYGNLDRWMLRHMRCQPHELPKRMTGYSSKAVTRLLWKSLEPVDLGPDSPKAERDWRSTWSWLALFRTWLPVDFTQQILRSSEITPWDDTFTRDFAKLRRFLKQWEPRQVVRMLTETCTDAYTIRDTMSMLARRKRRLDRERGLEPARQAEPLPKTRGVIELHDWLTDEQNRIYEREREERAARRLAAMTPEQRAALEAKEAAAKAPFEHSKELKVVDGKCVITPDGVVHTIKLPESPDQLSEWGSAMHNCIGGYTDAARAGHILGVKTAGSDRAIDWGIEICEGEINQFRGVCNVEAPADLRAAVERILLDNALLTLTVAPTPVECLA